jgi:uncharacterized protein
MTTILLSMALAVAFTARAPEETRLETPTGTIYGTLLVPDGVRGPVPVVLIIAGSGPTDRDGNSPLLPGHNNSLRMLAEYLAGQGIASLRYDKRAIAASRAAAKSEAELRFTNYVEDAEGWVRQLRADPRFSTITIAGHSEGSLIGMIAAREAGANGFVSLAGVGRSLGVVLAEQLGKALPPDLQPAASRILDELMAGRTVADVPQSLFVLFRPTVQPYLISQLTIDPSGEIAKLRIPVLIVQGNTDVQVQVVDAERLAEGRPDARKVIIDGMNHVLKEVRDPAQQAGSYSNPDLPLHPELGPLVSGFVRGLPAAR